MMRALRIGGPDPSRTYPQGRVCAIHNCTTELSVLNSTPVCFEHRKHVAYRWRKSLDAAARRAQREKAA